MDTATVTERFVLKKAKGNCFTSHLKSKLALLVSIYKQGEKRNTKVQFKIEDKFPVCAMTTQKQQTVGVMINNAGSPNFSTEDKDEEMTRSALASFRAKEEEIERRKTQIKEKVQSQLGRVEEETKRLAEIREELESLTDPMRKEVTNISKRIDLINRDLKPLGLSCQKKEKEYKEVLEAFNEKNKEKGQLVAKLVELVTESEKLRLKKLEELSKNIDSLC
ncbi:hypothetical protein ACJIZ3_012209 [Penstemon smallii]|uniref:RAB6-interacting golgin n=1 Tax=Penstemon smallii TaxID=265156 RepID=A0ABD3UPY2_9LAMI